MVNTCPSPAPLHLCTPTALARRLSVAVVHGRHEEQGKAQETQDGQAAAYVRIIGMQVGQGDDAVCRFPPVPTGRRVPLDDLLYAVVDSLHVSGPAQAEDGIEHVVSPPSVAVDVSAVGMDGSHEVIMSQEGILRHVAVDAAHGQHILLVQRQLLAYGAFVAEGSLGEALGDKGGTRAQQVALVTLQHLNAHRAEIGRVGPDVRRAFQQLVAIIHISSPIGVDGSGRLHPLGHLFGQGRRHDVIDGPVVGIIADGGLQRVGVFGTELDAHHGQPVGLGVAVLIIQLVGYLREEQHAHQQAEGQRQQLDETGRTAPAQGLYGIV